MKYILIGGIYNPKEIENIMESNRIGLQFAAQKFQLNILRGLYGNGEEVECISMPYLSSYPRRSKIKYFVGNRYLIDDIVKVTELSYSNLFIYKTLRASRILFKGIKQYLKSSDNDVTLIFYSVSSANLDVIKKIKKKYPNIKIILFVPDLPLYTVMGARNKQISCMLAKNSNEKLIRINEYVDHFVFITQHMAESMNISVEKYSVIEGMIEGSAVHELEKCNNSNLKTILYTGTLTRKYGVMTLIEAFQLIKGDEYRLEICGDGETVNEIRNIALNDPRIIYKGVLCPAEVELAQKQCTILVNPRTNDEEYTKYSFPSKMMEYLLSGKPTVCYKLDGFPSEYDEYFNYPVNNTVKALADEMTQLCDASDEERCKEGLRNRDFVLQKKNNIEQISIMLSAM